MTIDICANEKINGEEFLSWLRGWVGPHRRILIRQVLQQADSRRLQKKEMMK